MKIVLDQDTLDQAVRAHLRNQGVTAEVAGVTFRYNRSPYSVFAEVELSEARVKTTPTPRPTIVEKEVILSVEPVSVAPIVPMLDPTTVLPEVVEPMTAAPDSPSAPLFGGE